jgi:hypothetical protein
VEDDKDEPQNRWWREPRNFGVTPGIVNRLIEEPTATPPDEVIDCHERLRGMLKHYHRIVASHRGLATDEFDTITGGFGSGSQHSTT